MVEGKRDVADWKGGVLAGDYWLSGGVSGAGGGEKRAVVDRVGGRGLEKTRVDWRKGKRFISRNRGGAGHIIKTAGRNPRGGYGAEPN